MSKPNARKKARRQKRIAVRQAKTVSVGEFDEHSGAELAPRNITETIIGVGADLADRRLEVVDLVEAAADFERRVSQRGWVFDADFSNDNGFASFYFPASGTKFLDDRIEPVTRIWMAISTVRSPVGDERFFPNVHVILVGWSDVEADWRLHIEDLFECINEIEAYRAGDPALVGG